MAPFVDVIKQSPGPNIYIGSLYVSQYVFLFYYGYYHCTKLIFGLELLWTRKEPGSNNWYIA